MTTTSDRALGARFIVAADSDADFLLPDSIRPFHLDTATDADAPDVAELIEENHHLRARLDTLPIIEQPKGILMLRYHIDGPTAFALLRRWSSHSNHKLRHLSRLIVDAATRDARSHGAMTRTTVGPTLEDVLGWLQEEAGD